MNDGKGTKPYLDLLVVCVQLYQNHYADPSKVCWTIKELYDKIFAREKRLDYERYKKIINEILNRKLIPTDGDFLIITGAVAEDLADFFNKSIRI